MERRAPGAHESNLPPGETIHLRYRGDSAVAVRGAWSETTYLFAPNGNGIDVHERDAEALLASGEFVHVT